MRAVSKLALRDGRQLRIEEAGFAQLETIQRLNQEIFDEERVINTFEREELLLVLGYLNAEPVAFKVGYRENRHTYYSAKGGVLPEYRRFGIARLMLYDMMERARSAGYRRFAYDTFPNRHVGMAIMGFQEGFKIVKADYNPTYKDFRIRLEKRL